MEFTIYSIGSAAFLEEILNSVAMISGTGQIESLARIGLIVGVFILGFQAVMNNTGIQFQKVLVCLILYLAMYGPSGRALIEDVYTGDVAVVDNVPLGPLAVGSIVSNIGYVLTNTFEQAFSTPGMTNYGFADPLNTLVQVRKIANNVISLGSMTGAGANESLMASWSNYMRECTLVAANNDERALHSMLGRTDAIAALKFDSNVYFTKIYDGSADGVVKTCTDAFSILSTMTTGKEDELLGDIGKGFTQSGTALDSAALEAKLNDALQYVANGVVDARTFAVMSAVLPILEGAPSAKSIDDMQGAAAIMMSQAMQQQNTQWAAEGSMFTRYIRPFMTFFEGFIYAITPLMAFVIVLGGFGIGLVAKYLLILIWMVLWMPVLSIVNLYALNQTQVKIEAITGGSFAVAGLSFNHLRDMLPILEQQIGVAGMMASSVPALCMFLVYGTSVAASGIAARLNGSDTINEKIASPDVVQPGPGLSMSSAFTSDPTMGTRSTGSEALRPTINTGSMLEKAASSAKENLTASSISYNQAFQKQLGQSISSGASKAEVAELGSGLTSALGLNESSAYNSARQAAFKMGATQSDVDAFVAQVAAGGEAKLSFGSFGGVKAGATTNSQDTQSTTNSTAREQQDAVSAELKSAVQSNFSKDNAQRTAERLQTSKEFNNNAAFTDALSKQSADLQQSKESYSQVMSFKDSYGMQTSTSIDALAQDAINRGTAGQLNSSLDNLSGKERDEAMAKKDSFMRANATLMGNQNADVAGSIYALASAGRYDMLGAALGNEFTPIDANANAGIGQVANNGNEAAYESRGIPTPQFDPEAERASIIARGEQNVNDLRSDSEADVNTVYGSNVASMGNDRAAEARMQWAENGMNLTTQGIISNPTNAAGLQARTGGSEVVSEEKYRLGYQDAIERNLPQPLAEIAGNASRGIVDDAHVRDTVIELQRDYGLSGPEAMGAINATVAGAVSHNQDGGHQYADIAEVFNAKGSEEALTDRSYAPSNVLKLTN